MDNQEAIQEIINFIKIKPEKVVLMKNVSIGNQKVKVKNYVNTVNLRDENKEYDFFAIVECEDFPLVVEKLKGENYRSYFDESSSLATVLLRYYKSTFEPFHHFDVVLNTRC